MGSIIGPSKNDFFELVSLHLREDVATEKSVKSHLRKENKCSLHAVSKRKRETRLFLAVTFRAIVTSNRYLWTEVFIQVAIAIKVAILSRKRNIIEFMKHSDIFEKTTSMKFKKYSSYTFEKT